MRPTQVRSSEPSHEITNFSSHRIKKAYRKKALELHPDRNYGDVENATIKFAEVQSAYEVLSDPQERAWYDSHRESILRGDNGTSNGDRYERNVHLTSARDIVRLMGKFNTSLPLTDGPNGFFGVLQSTFASLAAEEESASDWAGVESTRYPEFGTSRDDYEDVVKPFYRFWINFSTKKTFSWRDAYKASDAPDRGTRRVIERENKKLRDEGVREFNDAVRALVAFVRKRDPRFIPNSQTEAERQKILRDAAAAQAARSRAVNQAKLEEHVVPEWAKTNTLEDNVANFTDSSESEVEHIECVACGKIFKSEKQYEAHERSKKHKKAIQLLQKEMWKEDRRLNLDDPSDSVRFTLAEDSQGEENETKPEYHVEEQTLADHSRTSAIRKPSADDSNPLEEEENLGSRAEPTPDSSGDGDEYAPREEVEDRLAGPLQDMDIDDSAPVSFPKSIASDNDETVQPRLGKAKSKRAKRAARQEMEAHGTLEVNL